MKTKHLQLLMIDERQRERERNIKKEEGTNLKKEKQSNKKIIVKTLTIGARYKVVQYERRDRIERAESRSLCCLAKMRRNKKK
jgi:hypothetical protein